MAELVIIVFEIVNIYQEEKKSIVLPESSDSLAFQIFIEIPTIKKASESVTD